MWLKGGKEGERRMGWSGLGDCVLNSPRSDEKLGFHAECANNRGWLGCKLAEMSACTCRNHSLPCGGQIVRARVEARGR